MKKKTILAILGSAIIVCGQVNSGNVGIAIFPPPAQAFEEIKQYLALSDTQVNQLRSLLDERTAAAQEIYRQIEAKQTELNVLLRSGSRDLSRIGQLTIDIHTLSTQAPPPSDQWRQKALAVLTPEQRVKLGPLDQALKLSTPAHQAVTLNLVDAPPAGRPIPLPMPLPSLPAPGTPVPLPTPLP